LALAETSQTSEVLETFEVLVIQGFGNKKGQPLSVGLRQKKFALFSQIEETQPARSQACSGSGSFTPVVEHCNKVHKLFVTNIYGNFDFSPQRMKTIAEITVDFLRMFALQK
jgi:hypothetical protein